jgi:hypothetical protein
MFQVGDQVKAKVTGDYSIAWEVVAVIIELWRNNRVKIETPCGWKYLVHEEDLEIVNS